MTDTQITMERTNLFMSNTDKHMNYKDNPKPSKISRESKKKTSRIGSKRDQLSMSPVTRKLLITEILMTVTLVVFIALCLRDSVRDDVSLTELTPVLLQEVSDSTHMQEAGAMKLRSLYGLTENDYQEVSLYIPVSNMDAQEMLLIRCKDESQTQAVEEAMQNRIDYNRSIFESYGVEQMGIISTAVVETRGLYCLYICDTNSQKIRNTFGKMLKK